MRTCRYQIIAECDRPYSEPVTDWFEDEADIEDGDFWGDGEDD
jgi:hypothetical protein